MCVLVVCDKRRPTEEESEKMAQANGDGIGLAWRDVVGAKGKEERVIKWEKGLELSEAKSLIDEVPMPFVLHFRIASCGGKHKELTHPFPVEREMRKDLSGVTKGKVLFHNGHWNRYQDVGIDNMVKNRVKLPLGKWSDTRVMAWMTHMHGEGFLELLNEKVILFGTEKIEIFHPDGWARVNDLLVSNRLWENQYINNRHFTRNPTENDEEWENMYQPGSSSYFGGGATKCCRTGNCKKVPVYNTFYCEDHQPPCKWAHCSKPRVFGTDHCSDHQLPCSEVLCNNPREVAEKYCLKHLKLKAEAAKIDAQHGGTALPVPFRSGDKLVPAGSDKPAGAGLPESKVDKVDGGAEAPAVVRDPIAQEMSTWARSLNPKAIKTPHVRPNMEILRILKDRDLPTTNVM